MSADIDLQVWLATQQDVRQTIVVPYIKSARDERVNFKIAVFKSGVGGTSRIEQGGMVTTEAEKPVALSQLALNIQKQDECRIEVVVRNERNESGVFRFDCPRS